MGWGTINTTTKDKGFIIQPFPSAGTFQDFVSPGLKFKHSHRMPVEGLKKEDIIELVLDSSVAQACIAYNILPTVKVEDGYVTVYSQQSLGTFKGTCIIYKGAEGAAGSGSVNSWPDVSSAIAAHNTSGSSHADIRALIDSLVNSVPTGGQSAQVLTKKTETDFDSEWKDPAPAFIERVHSVTQTLTAGAETTIMLPTSKITGLVTKVYANGALVGVEGVNAIVSGNVLKFTSKQTASNAEIEIFYSSPAGELPKNYQYVSVDFKIDEPDTTVAGAADVRGASEGAMFSFDWGDGSVELLACDSTLKLLASHTYENAGTYTVTITDEFGQMTGCFFNSQAPKVVSRVNRFEGTEITTLDCVDNRIMI